MNVGWLIVGTRVTGATMAERIASHRGETVLLVEPDLAPSGPHIKENTV